MSAPTLAKLGAWVAAIEPGDLPAETRRAARYEVLDMIAAAHASAGVSTCRGIESAARATAGTGGRSTVIASGAMLPPIAAAQVNAAYTMALDFDSILWMGHICHSAVFAPLAVAEHEGTTSTAMLTAVVVANEIGGRLGASCFLGPLNGQMWSFIHLIGAAAATAKLLGLDAERTAHAMAIALAQPNFPLQPGFFRPTSKLLTASTPTGDGIRAAYLARDGVTGALDLLEDERGFWHQFAFQALPQMLEDLGELWVTETLAFKTYPGCFFFQTTCSAIAQLLERHPRLAPDEVERVLVETTKLSTEVTRFAQDYAADELSSVNVGFDLAMTAAIMLYARRLTANEHDDRWLAEHAEGIRAWRRRVDVTHDPALTLRLVTSARAIPAARSAIASLTAVEVARVVSSYRAEYRSSLLTVKELVGWVRALGEQAVAPESIASPRRSPSAIPLYFPGRVTFVLRDGRRDSAQLDLPIGSFAGPHVEREVRAKFMREVIPALGAARAEAAFEAGLSVEASAPSDFARSVARASS